MLGKRQRQELVVMNRVVAPAPDVGAGVAEASSAWPSPPHDLRPRACAISVGEWEVRLFVGSKLDDLVARGFWHLQLWHPRARGLGAHALAVDARLLRIGPPRPLEGRGAELCATCDAPDGGDPHATALHPILVRQMERTFVDDVAQTVLAGATVPAHRPLSGHGTRWS
jgi:hypothetical protein